VKVKGVAGRVAVGCVLAAAIALVALSLAGNLRAGIAVAAGLVLGSANSLLAKRALDAGFSPQLSSLPRLGILSAAAIGVGVALGLQNVWLVILGVAAAQGVLVAVAAGSVFKR
jgi:hypothetical protein